MPQGQQKSWYVQIGIISNAKILLFTHLHIGYNGKMIAQLFFDEKELLYIHFFINKNIIYP